MIAILLPIIAAVLIASAYRSKADGKLTAGGKVMIGVGVVCILMAITIIIWFSTGPNT